MENDLRSSNLELLRIIAMLVIVAHHYVVNSGLISVIKINPEDINSLLLLIFGWGGKTAINCFVLITGYFMCEKNITIRKYLKLLLQVVFYNVMIGIVFTIAGYEEFNMKFIIAKLFPFNNIGNSGSFTSTYLYFFLLFPFINTLIKNTKKDQYKILLLILILGYSVLPSIGFKTVFSSIIWFTIIYFIGAYIKLFIDTTNLDYKKIAKINLCLLLVSWSSIILMVKLEAHLGKFAPYFCVADENKLLALLLAICTFLFFLKVPVKNSKSINAISSASFGVFLIHTNSAAMRTWLWSDFLNNVGQYGTSYMIIHAIGSVLGIYIVCTIIDMFRIKYLEKPILDLSTNIVKKLLKRVSI